MWYIHTARSVSATYSLKESVVGHPELEGGKVVGLHYVERSQKGHPMRINQWSDKQDGEKQILRANQDDGMPPREEKQMPDEWAPDKGDNPDKEGHTSMQTHTGEERKEWAGSTLQGDQEKQTPEKEDLTQRRSGRRNEIQSGIEIRTVYEQNRYLFA